MDKSINDLKIGEKAVVTEINCLGTTRRRIIDMGLTPGVTITVVQIAPMGDPIEIQVRGYELSLRRSEARRILVILDD